MTFDYPRYPLIFIQKQPCKDASAHLFTLIYKFYSPVTKLKYILRADYHEQDVFGIKFYASCHKRSEHKYSKITNKGDVGNILISCLNVIPIILKDYPNASFGFIGARTIDFASNTVEDYKNTQRFRIYKEVVPYKIGPKTFEHIEYTDLSGYLLINRKSGDIDIKERKLIEMFTHSYQNILDV